MIPRAPVRYCVACGRSRATEPYPSKVTTAKLYIHKGCQAAARAACELDNAVQTATTANVRAAETLERHRSRCERGLRLSGRVMVDELRVWTNEGLFSRGSCHLTADNLDDLHAFAASIGMRRQWFQDHRIAPHYDLTPDRRAYALRMGAVFVPIRVQLASRRKARAG